MLLIAASLMDAGRSARIIGDNPAHRAVSGPARLPMHAPCVMSHFPRAWDASVRKPMPGNLKIQKMLERVIAPTQNAVSESTLNREMNAV